MRLTKLKIVTIWPFQKKSVAAPCHVCGKGPVDFKRTAQSDFYLPIALGQCRDGLGQTSWQEGKAVGRLV